MKFSKTSLQDAMVIDMVRNEDERGFFARSFCEKEFADAGLETRFVQQNHSYNRHRGTLRGMHFQTPPFAQAKLVRVARGRIFDVAVDLRRGSPTYRQWVGHEVSADDWNQILVPEGFAHGFYVISDSADFLYKCTNLYAPEHERCIRWDAPELAIDWPLVDGLAPQVSAKDAEGKTLRDAEVFV